MNCSTIDKQLNSKSTLIDWNGSSIKKRYSGRIIICTLPFKIQHKQIWIQSFKLIAVEKLLHFNSRFLWQSIQLYLIFMLLNYRSSKKSSLFFHHAQTVFNPEYLNHRLLLSLKLELFRYLGNKEINALLAYLLI